MSIFHNEKERFFKQFNEHGKMVLSTAINSHVTSRMMSIIIIDEKFYFQTDVTLRKYEQLKKNPQVALCINNIQIEGKCEEIGHPLSNDLFCELYKTYYSGSYEGKTPFIERLDFTNCVYDRKKYCGK